MQTKTCPNCHKVFTKQYNYSKKYWEKQKYCSIKCSGTLLKKGHKAWNKGVRGKTGEMSTSWKGGRNIAVNGYVRVLVEGTGSYALEHRLVMEKHLGRKLDCKEHVHHINHNRTDNRIENLELINIHEHNRIHTQERWNNKDVPFRNNLTLT